MGKDSGADERGRPITAPSGAPPADDSRAASADLSRGSRRLARKKGRSLQVGYGSFRIDRWIEAKAAGAFVILAFVLIIVFIAAEVVRGW
jgi:hypothetical protein